MKKRTPAESSDAQVELMDGVRHEPVKTLRTAVRGSLEFEERIEWGHLVDSDNGPVLLIRALSIAVVIVVESIFNPITGTESHAF